MAIDKKIQEFRATHRIDDETGSSALESELLHARDQLSTEQSRLLDAQTAFETINAYASGGANDYEKLPESVRGASLDRLRASLSDAQGALAAARARLGAFHPDVKAQEGHLTALKDEIAAEARRKLQASKMESERLTARVQTLREEMKTIEGKVHVLKASETQLTELQREREATKTLYDSMLAKVMQANLQQTLNFAQFRIYVEATVPKHPKRPVALFWGGGIIGGLAMGLFFSLLWDLLPGRIVMLDDLKKQLPERPITQVPLIGLSDFEGLSIKGKSAYLSFAKRYPWSLFTNNLLAVHRLAGTNEVNEPSKVIMITSPTQGCGKTHISSNLACLSAFLGAKSLLIDLDTRKNSEIDELIDGPPSADWDDFLKENSIDGVFAAAHRTEAGDYDILQVKAPYEGAHFRFFQTRSAELIEFARKNYNYIWIDTPPVGIFNDPLLIARQVDGVVVVAEWSKTTIKQLKDTINLIVESGGLVISLIINKVQIDNFVSEAMTSYGKYYKDRKDAHRQLKL